MTFKCRYIDYNEQQPMIWEASSGEVVHIWGWGIWEFSILSTQFYTEPKTTFKKNKVY